ncbi:MAG: flagellar basal body rod protein FlgB [Fimbriimonadales bacterium]
MKILENLFGPQIDRLSSAMSKTSRRHKALVDNLANVNSPGYKRKDTDMYLSETEAGLSVRRGRMSSFESSKEEEVRRDETPLRMDGNSVDLEKEIVAITETQLHYGSLSTMTRKYFQTLHDVIRGGR